MPLSPDSNLLLVRDLRENLVDYKTWLPDKTKFYNASGRRLGVALVDSWSHAATHDNVTYTASKLDRTMDNGRILPSLYKLYLAQKDLSEVKFACRFFMSYDHWTDICECRKDIVAEIDVWRTELKHILKSDALGRIATIAADDQHKQHYDANKFLIMHGLGKTKAAKESTREPNYSTPTTTNTDSEQVRLESELMKQFSEFDNIN